MSHIGTNKKVLLNELVLGNWLSIGKKEKQIWPLYHYKQKLVLGGKLKVKL
jgi:hypothetical protein